MRATRRQGVLGVVRCATRPSSRVRARVPPVQHLFRGGYKSGLHAFKLPNNNVLRGEKIGENNSATFTVDVPIYRPVVARPKRTGKQGKPVNWYLFTGTCRYTGENARTCTRRADVSPQTSIWRVCVSPAVVVACNYSIISARVCNTAVHRRQQFSYDSSALSAQAGVHSIGTVPKT